MRFVVDGVSVSPASVAHLAGGARFAVSAAEGARALEVVVDQRPVLALRLAPAPPPSPALERARALRSEGKLDDAAALASAERAAASDEGASARAVGVLARIALSRGDEAQVDALFAQSIDAEERAGRPSAAADDAFALVYSLTDRRRFVEAARVLSRARELSHGYPDGQVRAVYYAAQIASWAGRWRDALHDAGRASAQAERLGLRVLGRNARGLELGSLMALGRASEAVDGFVALYESDAADMGPCDAADVAMNVGAAALEDPRKTVDARTWLERARRTYLEGCASSYEPARLANVYGDLARVELERRDLRAARGWLAQAERAVPHPRVVLTLEWLRTRGDIGLAAGDTSAALAAFDALAARARAVGAIDEERIALEGRAEALVRRGDRAGAEAALLEATKRTDEQSAWVPLGEGREGFVRARERADARRVELLVQLGRPADALAHLRRARARVLASLAREGWVEALPAEARARWDEAVGAYARQRDALDREAEGDWKLAATTLASRSEDRARCAAAARTALEQALADALADRRPASWHNGGPAVLAPGELVLALQSSAQGAWIGIAEGDGGVRARVLGAVDAAAPGDVLAAALLAPFAPEIARARRIAVLAFGEARRVDVHALPWEGAPLVAHAPVVYPVVGDAHAREDDAGPARRALVVGDPTLDLGGAHVEMRAVQGALAGRWETTTLAGDAATRSAVRAALAGADLFHYAGHARFAGRDGWESALRLADDAQLGVADVLALGHAPRVVVLLGCETARTSSAIGAEGLGIAHAFVVAGARAVVASSRVVDDDATARLAVPLYASLARGDDAASALRDAQRALAAAGAKDWEAFRVLVP